MNLKHLYSRALVKFKANTTGDLNQDFYVYVDLNANPQGMVEKLQGCLYGLNSPLENFLNCNPNAKLSKEDKESENLYRYDLVFFEGELHVHGRSDQGVNPKLSYQGSLAQFIKLYSQPLIKGTVPRKIAVYRIGNGLTGEYPLLLRFYSRVPSQDPRDFAELFIEAIKMRQRRLCFAKEFFNRNENIHFFKKDITPGIINQVFDFWLDPNSGAIKLKTRGSVQEFCGTLAEYLWSTCAVELIGNELKSDYYAWFWYKLQQLRSAYQLGDNIASRDYLVTVNELAKKLEIFADISPALADMGKVIVQTSEDGLDVIDTRYREIRCIVIHPEIENPLERI